MYNGIIELSSNFTEQLVLNMCSCNDSLIKYCFNQLPVNLNHPFFTVSDYMGKSYKTAGMLHVKEPVFFKYLMNMRRPVQIVFFK
jgi:hypothetical protein